jgi:hypothetical protein
VTAPTVAVFVTAGLMAHEDGVLDRALAELSIRLDLDTLMATCWGPDRDDCPHCAIPVRYQTAKPNPQPHPKPTPPPPPPPPTEGAS